MPRESGIGTAYEELQPTNEELETTNEYGECVRLFARSASRLVLNGILNSSGSTST